MVYDEGKSNKDLLTLKVFGYSNLKIFFILAIVSFLLGWLILIIANQSLPQCQNTMSKLNRI